MTADELRRFTDSAHRRHDVYVVCDWQLNRRLRLRCVHTMFRAVISGQSPGSKLSSSLKMELPLKAAHVIKYFVHQTTPGEHE